MGGRRMNSLRDMLWIELRKATRSRMPLWTAIGSLFMPFGIAFLIFVAKNPEISKKLGLVSAKANLIAYSATDWPAYLGLMGQIIAAGGFFLFVLVVSWVFGREFADRTLKDMLAVPVPRSSILLAKFILVAIWSMALTIEIYIICLVMGAILKLPGGLIEVILHGSALAAIIACLVIALITPFAFFASLGRGYLLPIGVMILLAILGNLVVATGWGEYFPWSVPALFAQGSKINPISIWIVIITGLAGMLGTYAWWMRADQNR